MVRTQMDSHIERYIGWGLGGSWVQEILSPWSWSASLSWCGRVPSVEALWTHYYWDFIEASSRGHDQLLTPIPAPLPSFEEVGWNWKFQASNHGLVSLVTSPHPGAIQEPTQVTSLEQKMLLVLLSFCNLEGFQEPCVRDGVKDRYSNNRCSWCSYHLGNYKDFKSSVPAMGGQAGTNIYILFHTWYIIITQYILDLLLNLLLLLIIHIMSKTQLNYEATTSEHWITLCTTSAGYSGLWILPLPWLSLEIQLVRCQFQLLGKKTKHLLIEKEIDELTSEDI